jgi:hypothetical protein
MLIKRLAAAGALALAGSMVMAAPALSATASNDRYGDAIAISSLPFETTVDTTSATVSPGDRDCASSSHTVWYRFTPSVSGTYSFDVHGLYPSGPSLGVFVGHRRHARLLACDVSLGGEDLSGVAVDKVDLVAGTRYHIMIGTPGGLDDPSLPGGPMFVRAVRYVAPRVNVHVSAGTVDRLTHVLTLTGTVDCAGTYAYGAVDGFPDIQATVRQVRLGLVARGTGGTWPDAGCTAAARWTMTLQSETEQPFKRGWSTVFLRGYECNLWECVTPEKRVRLHLSWIS